MSDCIVPKVHGVGGMGFVFAQFSAQALALGGADDFRLTDAPYSAVLVIGGTRQLPLLYRSKQRSVRVVQAA